MNSKLCIGVFALSSALTDEQAQQEAYASYKMLEEKGYQIKFASNINVVDGSISTPVLEPGVAGSVAERLNAFYDIYSDPKVDLLLALRGGYGVSQILSHLDYQLIAKHKKMIWGYSDLTALFLAIKAKTGLASMHSPMLFELSKLDEKSLTAFFAALDLYAENRMIENSQLRVAEQISEDLDQVFLGSNLSMLVSLLGTKFLPDFTDCCLVLEDCNEELYKIDRMLQQLAHARILQSCKKIFFGKEDGIKYIFRVLDELCIEYQEGLELGHLQPNLCIRLG